MPKQFSYFDHEADIGITGSGDTIEAAFEAAAEATFAIMTDLSMVRPERHIRFHFREPDIEFALVTWLNRLLAEARSEGMVLGRFHLVRDGADWFGEAWGEPWRQELEHGTEVKGATLTMLSVGATNDGWEARCVVDV